MFSFVQRRVLNVDVVLHMSLPVLSTDCVHHSVSSPPISWCMGGVLAQYGCRRIIQVDAAQWWWMRRYPPYVKRFEYLEKRYINATNYYYCVTPFWIVYLRLFTLSLSMSPRLVTVDKRDIYDIPQ